ncbi:MAG: hypothetical protein IPP29_13305 [Bacteroidetes bacterium]|nr:hypothetical protein [Bacteroidota bacterium]
MKSRKIIQTVFVLATCTLILSSCKKDKAEEDANQALIDEVNSSGYTYYQNGTCSAEYQRKHLCWIFLVAI